MSAGRTALGQAFGWAGAALGLALLVGRAVGGEPFHFDRAIILALRRPDDLAQPIGPAWLHQAMIDVTALGSGPILTVVVAAVVGLLLVRRRWLTAALVTAATISGGLLAGEAKLLFARPRPQLVDHLVQVRGLSFPSGHATNSAIIYLTLALLVGQVTPAAAMRRYLMTLALLLVAAIGCSRVYLGVHWPSDVLAGWGIGGGWALAWWHAGLAVRARSEPRE